MQTHTVGDPDAGCPTQLGRQCFTLLGFAPAQALRKLNLGRNTLGDFMSPTSRGINAPVVHVFVCQMHGNTQKMAVITTPDGSAAHDKGKAWPAKLVRGSKKGGAIRLTPLGDARTMAMGEGIETTASALAHGLEPGAVFWASVDLGNMAGRMARIEGTRWSGLPDLEDAEAWVPPPSVVQLVLIQDGDSDAAATHAKLAACIRRAQARRPDLTGRIVKAAEGRDFNDMRVELTKK